MTREEMWKEFENQLISETRTPITMSFDNAEKLTKLGIKETVAKWKKRLEQTRWIPVSERLPENDGVYIVSRWFSDGEESAILTDACYFDGTSTWHNDNRINHGREYVDKKIVAWMPLPEPYKGESEDEG